jgi:simple sugar transport system substrate-binding protein
MRSDTLGQRHVSLAVFFYCSFVKSNYHTCLHILSRWKGNQMTRTLNYLMLCVLLLVSMTLSACGTPPTSEQDEPEEAETEDMADDEAADDEAADDEATDDEATDDEAADDEAADDEATDDEAADDEATDDEATDDETADDEFVFGMVLVGPINDRGWSQAHFEGAEYVEGRLSNTEFIYVDKVNPADRPNVQVEQVVDDLIEDDAQFIITNSDDFKDGTHEAARAHPDTPFLHISGDGALTGEAPDNLGNLMGKMIYGKMIAGCAAALHTETGRISYLGPLSNDETRRLVNAAYLGAQYCYNEYRDEKPAEELTFEVVWIGFWFHIPGSTLDPTQVANDFINQGSDVIISGIDTTEALVEAQKATEAGNEVYALPYDYAGACAQAEEVCLGVPYFNWGPSYLEIVQEIEAGTWEPEWLWVEPDWDDINNPDSSIVGFVKGEALADEDGETLDTFIAGLADQSIKLFVGPLNFQDGTVYLEDGEEASEEQIWYTPQLLEGIEGQSE